jgi:Zn-dependent protease
VVLSFHLGKIPVRVQPWFFVLAVFLGSSDEMRMIVPWVAMVFAAVLLHELGHAGVGMLFGLQPAIELHGMGGTTSWTAAKTLSTAQRVAISLAGPFAGFAVWGVIYGLARAGAFPRNETWDAILKMAFFVNVCWSALNLLPMLPLDGGNVMAQLLNPLTGGRGERPARIISIVVAVALGALMVLTRYGGVWGAFLILSFVATNYQGLKLLEARQADEPMREALTQAYEAFEARDAGRVLALARPIALSSKTPQIRAEALQLVAFGFLLEGRVADADAAIAALPEGYQPHGRLLEMRAAAITASPAGS